MSSGQALVDHTTQVVQTFEKKLGDTDDVDVVIAVFANEKPKR